MRIRWQEETQAEATRENAAETGNVTEAAPGKATKTHHANQSQKRGKRMTQAQALSPNTPDRRDLKTIIVDAKTYNPNLTTRQIGEIANCDHSHVVRVLQAYNLSISDTGDFKKNRADIFAGIQGSLLQSLSPADIKKASLSQRVVAAGILYDKERLERDLSTQNIKPLVFFGDPGKPAPEDAPQDTIEGELIAEDEEK